MEITNTFTLRWRLPIHLLSGGDYKYIYSQVEITNTFTLRWITNKFTLYSGGDYNYFYSEVEITNYIYYQVEIIN